MKEYTESLEHMLESSSMNSASNSTSTSTLSSDQNPVLTQTFYLPFVFRSLAAVSALQLTSFNQQSTALSGIIKNVR